MSRTIVLYDDHTWEELQPDEVPPADTSSEYLSPHFRVAEFDCNHCGQYGSMVDPQLLVVLEELRAHFNGSPVTINSGVRCPEHNRNVGGASNSCHLSHGSLTGKPCAADIVVSGQAPSTVHAYLTSKYPDRYGIGHYSSFTHIDVREQKARW